MTSTLPRTLLTRARISTSRLAFGTSRLHHVDRRSGLGLLDAALDAGICHFDTAPSYGDGLAERQLGQFAQGRRDRLIIATKYGIPPNRWIAAWPALGLPIRGVRALARRAGWLSNSRPPLTASDLRISVERSLRRLRTDYIDILLLHEPDPRRIARPDELTAEAQGLVSKGHVRFVGLAGNCEGVAATLAAAPELGQVIQLPESQWRQDLLPDLSYGALARSAQSFATAALAREDIEAQLRQALRRRPEGAVIVSTRKPAHLALLAQIAREVPAPGSA